MPGVTISAGYGAGGSIVAPTVARALDLPLLDRAISVAVAAELGVSVHEAEIAQPSRSLADRFLSLLAPLAGGVLGAGTDAAPPTDMPPAEEAAAFREQAERVMRAALATGAVILGRAGAAAFRDEPHVLRVQLFGPRPARLAQAMSFDGVDLHTAEQRMKQVDAAREQYVRRLYRCSADDSALFHLHIDSTALALDTCAQLIVTAYRSLTSLAAAETGIGLPIVSATTDRAPGSASDGEDRADHDGNDAQRRDNRDMGEDADDKQDDT
jgi:cytidylate kinase